MEVIMEVFSMLATFIHSEEFNCDFVWSSLFGSRIEACTLHDEWW